ncbi:hypothetical protein ILUMI_17492, partial [Ignelater luminosus]
MFEVNSRDHGGPDTFADIEDDDQDYLINYWYFKLMYPKRFARYLESKWQVISTEEKTTFYTVDFSETPRITCSIQIDKELRVTVTLDGRCVDPCDLTWAIPITTDK